MKLYIKKLFGVFLLSSFNLMGMQPEEFSQSTAPIVSSSSDDHIDRNEPPAPIPCSTHFYDGY